MVGKRFKNGVGREPDVTDEARVWRARGAVQVGVLVHVRGITKTPGHGPA